MMNDDIYASLPKAELKGVNPEFIPSPSTQLEHEFQIEFKLSFQFNTHYWNRYPGSTEYSFAGENLREDESTAVVSSGNVMSSIRLEKALEEAIGDRLEMIYGQDSLIRRVMLSVCRAFQNNISRKRSGTVRFTVNISVKLTAVQESEYDDHHPRMVPAAESSMGMLEKCVPRSGDETCTICLEELGDGAWLRMPCSHVFHGDCIKEWLATSHICPLCRYEMPKE